MISYYKASIHTQSQLNFVWKCVMGNELWHKHDKNYIGHAWMEDKSKEVSMFCFVELPMHMDLLR